MDAHGAYTAEGAVHVGRVYWLEDPLPPEDVDGYVHLTATLEMAVAAGETECTRWQFEERLSRRAATVASLHNTRWPPTSAWVALSMWRQPPTWRRRARTS